jgi:hypothetical protein
MLRVQQLLGNRQVNNPFLGNEYEHTNRVPVENGVLYSVRSKWL